MRYNQYSILEFMEELKKIENEKKTTGRYTSRLFKLKKYSKRIIDILSNEIFRLRDDEKNCKSMILIKKLIKSL